MISRQTPRSRDTARVRTITTGLGYMWQMSPKTQLTLQFSRSLQNSTSTLESGEVNGINTVTKTDSYFASDNLAFSLNTRLTHRISAGILLNGVHTKTSVATTGLEEQENRQFHFPLSANLNYLLSEWVRFSFDYTFSYRKGNEKADANRAHTWLWSTHISI
ncbi:MAG: hypothetical protein JW893_09460, partial [Candidatus Omnitrophica bacterium]|nr:hypothetical protein [Candidatus Omnitrophota bacterium]